MRHLWVKNNTGNSIVYQEGGLRTQNGKYWGIFVSSKPPFRTGFGYPAEITDPWDCEMCKGTWVRTDQSGYEWMEKKKNKIGRITGLQKFTCEKCDGEAWTNPGESANRITFSGSWDDEENDWIFLGMDSELNGDILGWITIKEDEEFPSPSATEVVTDDDEDEEDEDEQDDDDDEEGNDDDGKPEEKQISMITVRSRTPDPQGNASFESSVLQSCGACGGRWSRISKFARGFRIMHRRRLLNEAGWNLYQCRQCRGGLWEGISDGKYMLSTVGVKTEHDDESIKFWNFVGAENFWSMSTPQRGIHIFEGREHYELNKEIWDAFAVLSMPRVVDNTVLGGPNQSGGSPWGAAATARLVEQPAAASALPSPLPAP